MLANIWLWLQRRPWFDQSCYYFFVFSGILSALISAAIIFVLLKDSMLFFNVVPLSEYLSFKNWSPLIEPTSYGIWPLVSGTFLVAACSAVIALPLGLGIGIYLSEFAKPRVRSTIKPVLEVMAGIPSIVYGYFALNAITPFMQSINENIAPFNAASASIVVAIMVLPMVCSLCDDALRAVPQSLREGALALGATRWEMSAKIILPSALSGVIASFILAISRAVGETMAVALAAGSTPKFGLNPFESIQTLTGYIVQVSMGDTPHDSVEYHSIFAVGLTLFLMTLSMNIIAFYIRSRFRMKYL